MMEYRCSYIQVVLGVICLFVNPPLTIAERYYNFTETLCMWWTWKCLASEQSVSYSLCSTIVLSSSFSGSSDSNKGRGRISLNYLLLHRPPLCFCKTCFLAFLVSGLLLTLHLLHRWYFIVFFSVVLINADRSLEQSPLTCAKCNDPLKCLYSFFLPLFMFFFFSV